jgi:hypothetical protein
MKNNNNLEILIYTVASTSSLEQKDLVDWLATTAQSTIIKQQERVKKIVFSALKDLPAIYLS